MALVLASTSAIRRRMLEDAGVQFSTAASDVDEKAFKAGVSSPGQIAQILAAAKAEAISHKRPENWVIGSDSVVSIGTRRFDKPRDRAEAAEHLRAFSGQSMILTSAVAIARAGVTEWRHVDRVRLQVRNLTGDFIAAYLEAEWPDVGYCVGVFRMEGRGVQLFDRIDGDYFTILGMPLLPLLQALRQRGLLAA